MSYVEATDTSLRKTGQIKLHGASGFAGMRKAGALVAKCLDELTDLVKPGLPTSKIDDFVREFAFSHGAYPATLMYRGYRYSTCTSINHVVCHGMPARTISVSSSRHFATSAPALRMPAKPLAPCSLIWPVLRKEVSVAST